MAWIFEYRETQPVPVEIEGITPDQLLGKSLDQVRDLPAMVGNRRVSIGELFEVREDGEGSRMEFHGSLSGVHWVGAGMTDGLIRIHGDGGRHIGSGMQGGRIEVLGNAGDWVGGEMQGGEIDIQGNAGHLVGAAYRGSRRGMTGGTILVGGSVGNELGHTMRRGLIAVGGQVGDLIGFNMLAGTIFTFGDVGIRHGAGMRRGTLGFFGPSKPPLLPTFRYACTFRPLAINMVLRRLIDLGFIVDSQATTCGLELYHGDLVTGGRGEVLLASA